MMIKDHLDTNPYKVDLSHLKLKRPIGISGIMRVKNDAEFLQTSIESCIDALDELIIVYNDCSDSSPEIIKRMYRKYPKKIKYYDYRPTIFSVGLSKEEFNYAKSLPEDSVNLLSNYYNFALSKASFRYALKIDADQVYFSGTLKTLLDAYRGNTNIKIKPSDITSFFIVFISLILIKILPIQNTKIDYNKYFNGYRNFVIFIVKWFKIPVSLSGINVFYSGTWYVTAGDINDNLNVLPPFNGVGDHIVFKISKKTKYRPSIQQSYNLLTSTNYSIIEKFVGVSKALPFGLMWYHMNSLRKKLYDKQIINLREKPEKFILFKKFVELEFVDLLSLIPSEMLTKRLRNLFRLLHSGSVKTTEDFDIYRYHYYVNNELSMEVSEENK